MIGCQRSYLSTIVVDVVLEMLNSEAIDMLEPADLFWIEGSTCSVSGSMQKIVHPRSQPLDVRCAEDGTAARFQDPENLREVILMVLDMLGDLDGNGGNRCFDREVGSIR